MSKLDKTIYNSFEQELIDNGYKIFQDNWKSSIRGFQKRIVDDKGTKYFITLYHYNFKKQHPEWDALEKDSYQFDVQFRIDKEGKDNCIDVRYSADVLPNEYRPVTTLKEIERFFEEFFITFNVDYYEKS
jgi:hypothetical protein